MKKIPLLTHILASQFQPSVRFRSASSCCCWCCLLPMCAWYTLDTSTPAATPTATDAMMVWCDICQSITITHVPTKVATDNTRKLLPTNWKMVNKKKSASPKFFWNGRCCGVHGWRCEGRLSCEVPRLCAHMCMTSCGVAGACVRAGTDSVLCLVVVLVDFIVALGHSSGKMLSNFWDPRDVIFERSCI